MNGSPASAVFRDFQAHDSVRRRLAVAFWPIDTVTGLGGGVRLEVRLDDTESLAVRNPSGYYCFTELADGAYSFRLTPAGADRGRFLEERRDLVLPPAALAQEVRFFPTRGYGFEATSSRLVGTVRRGVDGAVAAGAAIDLVGRSERSRTAADGTFAVAVPITTAAEYVRVRARLDGAVVRKVVTIRDGEQAQVSLLLPAA